MIIRYDAEITRKTPELYDSIQNSYLKNLILYFLDSRTRKSTNLREWLGSFVPNQKILDALEVIPSSTSYDEQVIQVLRYVYANIKYIGDKNVWDADEYWQTPNETITRGTGDCEDGAILMYYLCTLKGVPVNRLLILCGDVNGGGHCWLGYKPQEYPLNFVFLDWCYWYNKNSIDLRNKFYINDNKIYEYNIDNVKVNSNYYNIWFGFNNDTNIKKYRYSSHNRDMS